MLYKRSWRHGNQVSGEDMHALVLRCAAWRCRESVLKILGEHACAEKLKTFGEDATKLAEMLTVGQNRTWGG